MTTEAERLDEAVREALDVLTGWSFATSTDADRVRMATGILNRALQVESDGKARQAELDRIASEWTPSTPIDVEEMLRER